MNGDVEIVESEDHEMYRRRFVTQTATYAVTAYFCITKKKHKEFVFELYAPEK